MTFHDALSDEEDVLIADLDMDDGEEDRRRRKSDIWDIDSVSICWWLNKCSSPSCLCFSSPVSKPATVPSHRLWFISQTNQTKGQWFLKQVVSSVCFFNSGHLKYMTVNLIFNMNLVTTYMYNTQVLALFLDLSSYLKKCIGDLSVQVNEQWATCSFNALWGTNRNSCFHKLSRPSKCVNISVGYLLT